MGSDDVIGIDVIGMIDNAYDIVSGDGTHTRHI